MIVIMLERIDLLVAQLHLLALQRVSTYNCAPFALKFTIGL